MSDREQAAERLLANPAFLAAMMGRLMNFAAAALGVCLLFGGLHIYREIRPLPVKYFASTPDFDPIPMTPLDEPVMTNAALIEWAKTSALAAYNLDFFNYRQQSEAAKANFLPAAWNGWGRSFIETGNLEKIRKAGMQAIAVTHWPPAIKKEAVVDARRVWEIEFPMDFAVVNSNGGVPERRWVTVVVARTDETRFQRRIAIAQLVDRPWTEPARWGLGVANR